MTVGLLLFVPVVIDVLHIVASVEKIEDLVEGGDRRWIGQVDIVLGDHRDLRLRHGNARILERLADSLERFRIRDDFVGILFLPEVLGTRVQSEHHELIRVGAALLLVNNDLALLIEHEGDGAGCPDVAVSL